MDEKYDFLVTFGGFLHIFLYLHIFGSAGTKRIINRGVLYIFTYILLGYYISALFHLNYKDNKNVRTLRRRKEAARRPKKRRREKGKSYIDAKNCEVNEREGW